MYTSLVREKRGKKIEKNVYTCFCLQHVRISKYGHILIGSTSSYSFFFSFSPLLPFYDFLFQGCFMDMQLSFYCVTVSTHYCSRRIQIGLWTVLKVR